MFHLTAFLLEVMIQGEWATARLLLFFLLLFFLPPYPSRGGVILLK